MTTARNGHHTPGRAPLPLALPFPKPGPALANAYRELEIAAHGTEKQRKELGDLNALARPWDPATVTHPQQRAQLWDWLEAVTGWVNTEHVWDSSHMIPPCWPQHPHLVHDIAVLADLRHQAGTAFTSDALEDWHRYALPAFLDRVRHRTRSACEDHHRDWPARAANARYTTHQATRGALYRQDLDHTRTGQSHPAAAAPPADPADDRTRPIPRLHLIDGHTIDPHTGEILN
ncbi:hypothetical protein [uncultured Serinicoccus sp.]|uniref:hypothetical protein n=1 Tax=uncultured Serinicoccus sp. TaxID=735514 RepID=UPI002608C173|nr:hypothetical protein [uncultured Serinicoccus sp.]